MWVFTLDGFYSAVAHRTYEDTLVVRARDRGDIERLRNWLFLNQQTALDIQHTPEGDYEWRLFVPRQAWAAYLDAKVESLDYSNFKNAVAELVSHQRAELYGEVWVAMLALQYN